MYITYRSVWQLFISVSQITGKYHVHLLTVKEKCVIIFGREIDLVDVGREIDLVDVGISRTVKNTS